MQQILNLLAKTHLTVLAAFLLTLLAKVILEFHGTPTSDLTNILYGEVGALIGVPIVATATNSAHAAGVSEGRSQAFLPAATDEYYPEKTTAGPYDQAEQADTRTEYPTPDRPYTGG